MSHATMDPRLVQLLFSPDTHQNQAHALEYLESLHSSPDAWQICASSLASNSANLDDNFKFVCLQVLERYVKDHYKVASVDDQRIFRNHFLQWLTVNCNAAYEQAEKHFIRNKTAQVAALVFVVEYDVRWPSFVSDLLTLLQLGPLAADLVLKIFKAIDIEVVDREILHSQEEMDRGNLLKDCMRERDVTQMAEVWHDILIKYERSYPAIVCNCHQVIGLYISWMEITLIANERFVSLLVKHMQETLLRETAAECLLEVITKGMDPLSKFNLIESLCNVLDQAGLLKPIDDDESDFLLKQARLINGIGCQLIVAWQKTEKKDKVGRETIRAAIDTKSVLLLQFLASEYDDVSAAVFEFTRSYIQMIKQQGVVCDVDKGRLENLLFIIISKTKFDESYNFEQDGEDEAMFDQYRKDLKVVFDNLAGLLPDLVLKVCRDFVITRLGRWQAMNWQEIEACVALLYSLGEAIPAQHGNHFTGPFHAKATAMIDMMQLLVTCGVCSHQHPAVALQFFECVARYEKFFVLEPQHIPCVLSAFLDQRGMRNASMKVRSRCSYLFCRFVRCLKQQMIPYTRDVITSLQPLLQIACNRPANGPDVVLSPDDQLYVYEAAAILVVGSGSAEAQDKSAMMSELLSSVVAVLQSLGCSLNLSLNASQQAVAAAVICHCTAVTARTTKAFSQQVTMKTCNCVELYVNATNIYIGLMNIGVEREMIGSGVRQLLHRLVVCLDSADLLPLMPGASQALLHTPSAHSLTEYLPLMNQLITKFKKECSLFVESIISDLIQAIFAAVNGSEGSDDDDLRQLQLLRRNYYLFLSTLMACGLLELIERLGPLLEQVLLSIIHGAVEFDDPSAQKNCFNLLRKLVTAWGSEEAGPSNFSDFVYLQITPACFVAPLKSTFDLNDAASMQALHEAALCLKDIYLCRGDHFINYLREEYLPNLRLPGVFEIKLPPTVVNDFCGALTADTSVFKNYVKVFFKNLK